MMTECTALSDFQQRLARYLCGSVALTEHLFTNPPTPDTIVQVELVSVLRTLVDRVTFPLDLQRDIEQAFCPDPSTLFHRVCGFLDQTSQVHEATKILATRTMVDTLFGTCSQTPWTIRTTARHRAQVGAILGYSDITHA